MRYLIIKKRTDDCQPSVLGKFIDLITRVLGSDAEALATLTYRNGEAIVFSLTIVILGMQVLVGLGKELVDHLTVFADVASGTSSEQG